MATSMDVKDFTLGTAITIKLTNLSGSIHAAWNMSQGTVAHDAVDADNPLKIGARAVSTLSSATLVSAADRIDAVADLDGALIMRKQPLGDRLSGTNIATASTADTSCIGAQGAGIKTYLTDIILSNSDTTNTFVDIKDGTTVKIAKVPVPAGGGCVIRLESPIGGTANTAWQFASSASVTSLNVTMSGFKSKI